MSNSGVMLRRSSSSSSSYEEEEEEVNIAPPPIMRPNPRRYRPQRSSSPSSPSTTTSNSNSNSNSNSPPPRTRVRKPNPKFLSFLLQALIMIFVITVFFLFMGFAAIFLLHLCIAGRTIHRLRHRTPPFHYSSVQDDDYLGGVAASGSGSGALSPLDLQRIPAFNYLTLVDTTSATDCVVCLETFSQGQTFRLLPACKHAFHASCIDAWFTRASACPICRAVVEFDH